MHSPAWFYGLSWAMEGELVLAISWRKRVPAVNRVAVANLSAGSVDDHLATTRHSAEPFLRGFLCGTLSRMD
jgi:hypothetical protein